MSAMDPEFEKYMESVCLGPKIEKKILTLCQVNEAAPERHQATAQLSDETSNKRKRDETNESAKPKKEKKPNAPRENTSIYITGIPLDATFDEIHDKFKARCGLIMKNVDDEKPRIKMYADDDGNFKGDALISKCSYRPNSRPSSNSQQPSSKLLPSSSPCCYSIRPTFATEAPAQCASRKQT